MKILPPHHRMMELYAIAACVKLSTPNQFRIRQLFARLLSKLVLHSAIKVQVVSGVDSWPFLPITAEQYFICWCPAAITVYIQKVLFILRVFRWEWFTAHY